MTSICSKSSWTCLYWAICSNKTLIFTAFSVLTCDKGWLMGLPLGLLHIFILCFVSVHEYPSLVSCAYYQLNKKPIPFMILVDYMFLLSFWESCCLCSLYVFSRKLLWVIYRFIFSFFGSLFSFFLLWWITMSMLLMTLQLLSRMFNILYENNPKLAGDRLGQLWGLHKFYENAQRRP